jgi:hypothetical protein
MIPSGESSLWAVEEHRDRLRKDLRYGAVAGLLGGGSIMVIFLGYDALLFEPLATPEFLSGALMGQDVLVLDFAGPLRVVRILMFTILHLAVFAGLGIALTNLLRITGAPESLLLGGLYGLGVCTVLFTLILHWSGVELLAEPQWPAVVMGNFVAGVVMVAYLRVRAAL